MNSRGRWGRWTPRSPSEGISPRPWFKRAFLQLFNIPLMFCSSAHSLWEESLVDWWVSLWPVCNHIALAMGNPHRCSPQDWYSPNTVCVRSLVHTCFSHATQLPLLLGGLYAAKVKLQSDGSREVLLGLGLDFYRTGTMLYPAVRCCGH